MTKEYLGKVKLGSVASMTKAQRWAYLERHHEMALSTVDGDGVIYSGPMWYTVMDRRIFIPLDQASKHVKNLENGSSMSATVFSGGEEIATAQGVIIQGQGKLLEDPELNQRCVDHLVDHIFGVGHPHKKAYREYREYYDNATLELIPDKMTTWDMRKLYNFQMYSARSL